MTLRFLRLWALVTMLSVAVSFAWGQGKTAHPIDGAIDEIAQHMMTAYPLKAPRNNIAVMQFVPTAGQPRRIGENLMTKIRIRMFDLDKERRLNFVSQGKVTDLIVSQGADSLKEIYDSKRRVELGKLLTADHFVHGTYEPFSDGSVEIVAYLVEIESGLIRAQKVITATKLPEHLLEPMSTATAAAGLTPRSYRLSDKPLNSDPEAAKKYRMAELFEQRGRNDRSEALRNEILAEFPNSLEAMNVQARRMTQDVSALTAARRYDDSLFSAIQSVPVSYAGSPLFRELHGKVILWMVALGNRELENGKEPEARAYFDKARNLGLPESEYAAFQQRLKTARLAARAQIIRAHLLRGERDQAEVMLVEWEADEPKNPELRNLKKEFDRMEGMVTIPSGSVNSRQIDALNLDAFETTNKEFLEFVRANPDYQRGGKLVVKLADKDYLIHWTDTLRFPDDLDNRPVVFVSQPVADAYCKWRKKRLPTSDEWGLAAGEGRRKYPWGNKEPTDEIANFGKGMFGKPEPGEAFPQGRSPEGVYNLGGNVWELTSTTEGNKAVSRGGCYYDKPEFLESGYRGTRTKDEVIYTSRFMGLRCAQ
jgi:hypothetical protein